MRSEVAIRRRLARISKLEDVALASIVNSGYVAKEYEYQQLRRERWVLLWVLEGGSE